MIAGLARWRKYRLGSATFLLSVGVRGIGAILALALNVVLARLLGVVQYGRYMTWLSMGLVLGGLAVRGVDQVLTRELASGPRLGEFGRNALLRWAKGRLFRSAMLAALLFGAYVLVLQDGASPDRGQWLVSVAGAGIVVLAALTLAEAGAINGFAASLRSQALPLVVRNGAALALVGVFYLSVKAPQNAMQALWLQALGYLVTVLVGIQWLRSLGRGVSRDETTGDAHVTTLRQGKHDWTVASRHFFLVGIAALLVNRLDVVVIAALSGDKIAGTYAAGARLAQVTLMVAVAVNVVLSPRIASAHRLGNHEEVRRLAISGLAFTIPVAILGVVGVTIFAAGIVRVFGPQYAGSAAPLVWVNGAYALWAVAAPGYALLAMTGLEKFVAALSWLVVVVNVATMLMLVPLFDAAGGGMAMAAGYGSALVGLGVALIMKKGHKVAPT